MVSNNYYFTNYSLQNGPNRLQNRSGNTNVSYNYSELNGCNLAGYFRLRLNNRRPVAWCEPLLYDLRLKNY